MSEHPGITQRPPAYAELLIDSLDRYPNGFPPVGGATTSSDWRTNFQQNVLYGYFTRLAITQIQFSWNLPTIILNYNDRFTINVGAPGGGPAPANYNVVIAPGYYTPSGLAAAIQAALTAAAAAFTWTVTFTQVNGGFEIDLGPAPAGAAAYIVQPDSLIKTRCLTTLGFLNTAASSNNLPQLLIIGSPPTMTPTRFIDICSTYLTKFQRVKDSTTLKSPTISNVIARIYPTPPNTLFQTTPDYAGAMTDLPGNSIGSHPYTICIDYNTPKQIKWSPDEALANFDLQLRDDFGQLVPYNLGLVGDARGASCEYQLTLLASES